MLLDGEEEEEGSYTMMEEGAWEERGHGRNWGGEGGTEWTEEEAVAWKGLGRSKGRVL